MKISRLAIALAFVPAILFSAWSAAAIAIDGPTTRWLAASWVVTVVAICFALRPWSRALMAVLLLNAGVAAWWLAIPARNDRPWIAEVEKLASADFDGDVMHVHNVRNFEWRSDTDFTPMWEDRTYDLSKVVAADLVFSNWGPPLIAHTIMSWAFSDGRQLAISIETRMEVGEEYSATLGFFRQFELYYVVADERDVIGVRTNVRGENDHLYRLSATPEQARELLVDYFKSINDLVVHPQWYNAVTQNCTTSIWRHARRFSSKATWDWRILANGSAESRLYLRGSVDHSMPFEELRRRSDITAAARAAGRDENFSRLIRAGLPRMPASN